MSPFAKPSYDEWQANLCAVCGSFETHPPKGGVRQHPEAVTLHPARYSAEIVVDFLFASIKIVRCLARDMRVSYNLLVNVFKVFYGDT